MRGITGGVLGAILILAAAVPATAGEGVVEGVLRDSDGKPMKGILVRAGNYDRERGYRSVQEKTDAKGRYRLEGVELGENRISVQSLRADDQFALDITKLEVTKKAAKLDIKLEKTRLEGTIRLKDTGEAPKPDMRIQISIYHLVKRDGKEAMGGSAGMAFLAKDGTFLWRGGAPGRYRIAVYPKGYRRTETDITVKKGRKPTKVDIVLEPKVSGLLRIAVTDEEGEPLEGVDFSLRTKDGSLTLHMEQGDDLGVYETKELEVGKHTIYLSRKGYSHGRIEVEVKKDGTTEVDLKLERK